MTLADLTRDQTGVVTNVQGSDEVAVRLMEMGLTPGCDVTFVGAAPLGDPLEFEIRGYRLSLRKLEAARVEVRVAEDRSQEAGDR